MSPCTKWIRSFEVFQPPGGQIVQDGNLPPAADQRIDKVRTDETGTAGNQCFLCHLLNPILLSGSNTPRRASGFHARRGPIRRRPEVQSHGGAGRKNAAYAASVRIFGEARNPPFPLRSGGKSRLRGNAEIRCEKTF